MTSYEFEVAAKNAVINEIKNYDVEDDISKLVFVWFVNEPGYKKCTIWGPSIGIAYAEVTYNRDNDEMYVDIYQKIYSKKIPSSEFNFSATKENN